MTKLLIRFYFWYLSNYRGVHHFISLTLLSIFLYSLFGKEIFGDFFICLICLLLNYFATNWSIKKVGLDRVIEEEIKKIEKGDF